MDRVEAALSRLAEAQAGAEGRLGRLETAITSLAEEQHQLTLAQRHLAEAQAGTDARLGRLEAAIASLAEEQRQLTLAQRHLAEAQARTEVALQETQRSLQGMQRAIQGLQQAVQGLQQAVQGLQQAVQGLQQAVQGTQRAVRRLSRQVGGLSETVGGDIEDIAYIVLYDALAREYGWEVGLLERSFQQWNGAEEEVNIFGRATDPGRPERTIWIVGEAKHNLTLREVERFAQQVERARRHLQGEVFAVCFAYRARPEVRARLQALRIPLLFSYGRFA